MLTIFILDEAQLRKKNSNHLSNSAHRSWGGGVEGGWGGESTAWKVNSRQDRGRDKRLQRGSPGRHTMPQSTRREEPQQKR